VLDAQVVPYEKTTTVAAIDARIDGDVFSLLGAIDRAGETIQLALDLADLFSGQVDFKDNNDVWGEKGDASRAAAAVDAHYGASMTYDMIKNVLGRDSLDGAGEKLVSYVHVDHNLVNAFWEGEKMTYGDGNGTEAGPLTALDIAGHEIAHGLTEHELALA